MTFNPKLKKIGKYFAIASGAFFVATTIDSAPVVMAQSKLMSAIAKDPAVYGMMADLKAIEPCNSMAGQDGVYQPAWRECYLTAVPLAKSAKGAFVDAMKAHAWLKDHPSDDDVRARALAQIGAGWAAYKRANPTYVLMDDFERAVNRSIVLRLIGQTFGSRSLRTLDGELLEKAEVAIVAPDLFNTQQTRRATLAMAH